MLDSFIAAFHENRKMSSKLGLIQESVYVKFLLIGCNHFCFSQKEASTKAFFEAN